MKIKYKNDEITINIRSWLLSKLFWEQDLPFIYRSLIFEFEFNTFRQYWTEVGRRSALVQFISSRVPGKFGPKYYTSLEVVQRLARIDLGENAGIVLTNLSPSHVPRLMNMFPGVSNNVFTKGEYIVLPTQNKEAALKLAHSIPYDIADVTAFADGFIYGTNTNVE